MRFKSFETLSGQQKKEIFLWNKILQPEYFYGLKMLIAKFDRDGALGLAKNLHAKKPSIIPLFPTS